MKPVRHIHCIGIGGIGISALARYYLAQGYRVTGTNMGHSPLLDALVSEGIEIVSDGASVISEMTEKIIYTEAIIDDDTLWLAGVRPNHKPEIEAGRAFGIEILSYPEALAEVFHTFPMKIAVAGAHGKSTTSAMIGTILHDVQKRKEKREKRREEDSWIDSNAGATTITGTLVKAFNGKNICVEGDEIMNIEACEYRNAFLHYHPDIAVVTNIDPDHLDFFKTEAAYFQAFEKFMEQSRCVVILKDEYERVVSVIPESWNASEAAWEISGIQENNLREALIADTNKDPIFYLDSVSRFSRTSSMEKLARNDGNTLVLVSENTFELIGEPFNDIEPGVYPYILPPLLVPGDHIRLDASLAYVTSQLLHLDGQKSLESLSQYPGSWRRMEMIRTTEHSNILMSDYGHHPTEIRVTLSSLKKAHPDKKLIVFFEPHQYSRTYELREEFATCFLDADMTYISDIYAARDIDERRDMITSKILADMVARHSHCEYVGTLYDAREKLQSIDSTKKNALILLLGAGTIDDLRFSLS